MTGALVAVVVTPGQPHAAGARVGAAAAAARRHLHVTSAGAVAPSALLVVSTTSPSPVCAKASD